MTIHDAVYSLTHYAVTHHLIEELDVIYARNQLCHLVRVELDKGAVVDATLDELLDVILTHAVQHHIIEDSVTERDLFDTKVMNVFLMRPSQINETFQCLSKLDIEEATSWFYRLMVDVNYIRKSRTDKNIVFQTKTDAGTLDVSINISKPEKDSKSILKEANIQASHYPKCLLCVENVGYAGRLNHPARDNLRTIPITLNHEPWHFQYSPYVYYQEHAIVFHAAHVPMRITEETFSRLLDFVDLFPHYFIGSNADLPIVGGSILSHDHFQAGRHTFAIEASVAFYHDTLQEVNVNLLNWPLSTVRLTSKSKHDIHHVASHVLSKWRAYSDLSVGIVSTTQDVCHNTITPIARKQNGEYILDLILRNNRTDEAHPEGIFHPHRHLHHIKKENIGLIEAMGLAVLPARLVREKEDIRRYCFSSEILPKSSQVHQAWAEELKRTTSQETFDEDFEVALGLKFHEVLQDAGVFKQNAMGQKAFIQFIQSEVLA